MDFQIDSALTDFQKTFAKLSDNYFMNTHFLNDFNEVSNTNSYLNEKTEDEKERLETSHNRINAQLQKAKQEMQMKTFKTQDYNVKNNLLYTTLVVTSFVLIVVILFVKEKIGRNIAIMISLLSLTVLVFLVYIVTKANAYRVDTNWNMYHWGPVANA